MGVSGRRQSTGTQFVVISRGRPTSAVLVLFVFNYCRLDK